ncbi:hypothetical protein A374_01149 [Fictibacillus macauensis ZFHKF-1]|uniref:Uncharacterized protein n=1 Tax=Fictibacillus macauensis ZFHKF-1 TaxID=1196324 RepID=I8AMM7_9BACL|nr:hypothetical protein [Fictibacillus macauensis]EIT87247.1 hypothetical protein A374_01149 [Fictibacillus macauensis ZFHKF-1]
MNIAETARILNQWGIPTRCEKDYLEQVKESPYDNFLRLQQNGDKWELGYFIVERQNNPYFETDRSFETEDEAARGYLFDQLYWYYFQYKVEAFMLKHWLLSIGEDKFSIRKLLKAARKIGVPSTRFMYNKPPTLGHRSILVSEIERKKYEIKVYDRDGKIIAWEPAEEYAEQSLYSAYVLMYLLHIYEEEVEEILLAEGIGNEITNREILLFINHNTIYEY